MAMSPEKFSELFASLTTASSALVQQAIDCADIYRMTDEQKGEFLCLKLARQRAELRQQSKRRH